MDAPFSQVELLQTLIRFDTSNPSGNEKACIEFAGGLLEQAGIEHRYLALEAERPNLVARIAGRGDAPPLLLYGHVDVVAAEPSDWSHPPFGGDLIGGDVWGRGALDMKGGVAMLLSALMRASSSETPPAGDVLLALTSDEEAGSRTGMKFLVEEHAGLFTAVRHALSEFGGYTLWQGGRRFVPIQVAEKQRCLIRATVRGPEGHASTIVPGSASEKLGTLLSRIASRRLPVHVTPIARLVLESMATALPCREQLAIRGLFMPQVGTPLMRLLGSAAQTLAPLLCNTATPIGVRGGNGSKVVPTEFSVDLDGRVRPGFRTADLLGELESLADRRATFELVSEEPAAPANPDLSLMPVLRDVMRERDPGCLPIPMLLPGYTDARYTSRLGVQTYRFLPMRLPPEIGTWLVHAANERIPAETLEFGTTCLLDVIRRYR